jgi:hypothetical protein
MMTREGWIYLVILLFITSGGLLRNINLLILLNGLMVAPLLIGWRLCVTMVTRLQAKRSVMAIGFANQPVEVNWEIKNDRTSLASWQLVLQDQCQFVGEGTSWKRPEIVRVLFPVIRPKESVYQHYRVIFDRRGVYRFGPATVMTRFPFGLMQVSLNVSEPASVFVAPPVGKLIASWDRRLLSRATGSSSVKRKRGLQDEEFFALRTWRSGDSRKQVHWRTTAKYNQPMVRQFDTQTDKDFVLILDLFDSSLPEIRNGRGNNGKDNMDAPIETVLEFASTVFANLQGKVYGQISVAVCGTEGEVHSDHVYRRIAVDVLRSFATATSSPRPTTLEAIVEIGKQASEGTPVYVISTREKPLQEIAGLPDDARLRLAAIDPWLKWLSIDSPEFQAIFRRASELDTDETTLATRTKPEFMEAGHE